LRDLPARVEGIYGHQSHDHETNLMTMAAAIQNALASSRGAESRGVHKPDRAEYRSPARMMSR